MQSPSPCFPGVSPPSPPRGLNVTGVLRGLTINWQSPESGRGSVTNYFVSIQSYDDDGASFSYVNETIEGFVNEFDTRDVVPSLPLVQGVVYDVAVQSFSCSGVSDPTTTTAMPLVVPPGPPVDIDIAVINTTVVLGWQPPPYVDAAATNYTVFARSGVRSRWTGASTGYADVPRNQTVACCNATFADLTAGSPYVFGLFASDNGGNGPTVTTPTAVPGVGLPQPPQHVDATAAIGDANAALVTWSPSPDDGGSPLVSYVCTCFDNSSIIPVVVTVVEVDSGNTSAVMTSLPLNVSLVFVVAARSVRGSSSPSPTSPAATLTALAPQPPFNVFAYAVPSSSTRTACPDAAVVVEFTQAADHGGINVTAQSFVVSRVSGDSPGGVALRTVDSSPSQPICVDSDVAYAYTVAEVNSFNMYGNASRPSAYVSAHGGVQSAVTNAKVTPDTSVVGTFAVSWTFTGIPVAAPVQYFTVMVFKCSFNDADFVEPVLTSNTAFGDKDVRQATVSGGSSMGVMMPYCFVVVAVNDAGVGPWSSPLVNVSQDSVPPTSVDVRSAVGGNDSVVVTWSPPESNGGTPIVEYTLTMCSVLPSGSLGPPTFIYVLADRDPSANYSHALIGLMNGVQYQVTVTAANYDQLTSPCVVGDSSCTRVVTPCSVPDAPATPAVEGRDTSVEVSWKPPRDGGCDITNYTVYLRRRDDSSVTFVRQLSVADGTRYTWRHLGFSRAVSVRISANNSHGEGSPSPWSRRVVTTQAVIPVAPWQLGTGIGCFLVTCVLLCAADSVTCRRQYCCCRHWRDSKTRRSGGRGTRNYDCDSDLPAAAAVNRRSRYGSTDSERSLLEPRRASSSTLPQALTPVGSETDAVSDDDDVQLHPPAPTRYRSFIAVLLCILRLVFTIGITTYTYTQHALHRHLLWLQLVAIGVSMMVGFVTTYWFFASLKETYAVLHKGRRPGARAGDAVVGLSESTPSLMHSDALYRAVAVAPSYESWTRHTLCASSPIRMLSVFKPAVLEVLVSRAFGAAVFSMPVTEVFAGWR